MAAAAASTLGNQRIVLDKRRSSLNVSCTLDLGKYVRVAGSWLWVECRMNRHATMPACADCVQKHVRPREVRVLCPFAYGRSGSKRIVAAPEPVYDPELLGSSAGLPDFRKPGQSTGARHVA